MANFTVQKLRQIKSEHRNKLPGNEYNLPNNLLKVIKVSLNIDEFSIQRIHNLLKIFNMLKGKETIDLWNSFTYALKALKISSPPSGNEEVLLEVVYKDILELREKNELLFQELLLIFLAKLPQELADNYVMKIKPYIEEVVKKDFENVLMARLYVLLKKPELETVE